MFLEADYKVYELCYGYDISELSLEIIWRFMVFSILLKFRVTPLARFSYWLTYLLFSDLCCRLWKSICFIELLQSVSEGDAMEYWNVDWPTAVASVPRTRRFSSFISFLIWTTFYSFLCLLILGDLVSFRFVSLVSFVLTLID